MAEALRMLEDMSVESYLRKVEQGYGGSVLKDLLLELQGDLTFTKKLVLKEHHLYGSSRLGVKTHKRVLLRKEFSISGFSEGGEVVEDEIIDSLVYVPNENYFCRVLGQKQFELANHTSALLSTCLGNVLATVLDRRTAVYHPQADTFLYFIADVVSATMYYPFGSERVEYSNEKFGYVFGFNGKETDSETGLIYYTERIYNKYYGIFLSIDNIKKPFITPYQSSANNLVNYIDPDGNDEIHFYYTIRDNLDGEGKSFQTVHFSTKIIKDGVDELKFFMGNGLTGTKEIQFNPFIEGTRIGNSNSYTAAKNNLLFSTDRWLYGMLKYDINDYSFLAILMNTNPDVLNEYVGTPWYKYLKGAQLNEESRQLANTIRIGVETTYAIIDGYYLIKTIGGITIKTIAKVSARSFDEIAKSGTISKESKKSLIIKQKGSASNHFNEIVNSAGGNANDIVTKPDGAKTFTKGKETITLRESTDGPTVSKQIKGERKQIKIRFDEK